MSTALAAATITNRCCTMPSRPPPFARWSDRQELYQGTATVPGLCTLETVIPAMGVMEELQRRCPAGIAVVTGRPRHDYDYFLKAHNLGHLFKLAVCMEDGPHKPDPWPVASAAEQLGVKPSECVMVGDTPDDIVAAVKAGAVGVGVLTPEEYARKTLSADGAVQAKGMEAPMLKAGAAVVMEPGFAKLLDMFPPADAGESERPSKRARTDGGGGGGGGGRVGVVSRATKETSISAEVDLDGTGEIDSSTGIGFLDHMFQQLAKHGRFDIKVRHKCRHARFNDSNRFLLAPPPLFRILLYDFTQHNLRLAGRVQGRPRDRRPPYGRGLRPGPGRGVRQGAGRPKGHCAIWHGDVPAR